MKKVILVISSKTQATSSAFIREFEKLGGALDGIYHITHPQPKSNSLKSAFRFLKVFKPSKLKQLFSTFLTTKYGMQSMDELKKMWDVQGENSWDVLEKGMDIFAYAKNKGIPTTEAPLTTKTISALTASGPVIFPMYGGGILSAKILSNPKAEFMNSHMGEMPYYKGMNVMEWAILEEASPKATVMVMNEKIDGGDVVWEKEINISNEKSIKELRTTGYNGCFQAMAEGIINYQKDSSLREAQAKGSKFYYRMHHQIRATIESNLPLSR